MSAKRISEKGLIDRSRPLTFSHDGRSCQGYQGDTLVSALLAAGVRVMGRSFKYHRPRGPWSAWVDDPNAIFDVTLDGASIPNLQGAATALEDGMALRSVNAWPTAERDVKGLLDGLSRFLPAGFYYKTFMWPSWHLFEPAIRRMAGLGRLDAGLIDGYHATQIHQTCDLLVIGGGAAGLTAARAAAEAGRSVVLAEDHAEAGGARHRRGRPVDDRSPADWVREQVDAIEGAGGEVLTRTTVFGAYDHNMFALAEQRGFAAAPLFRKLRARTAILASGAIDRPVTFPDNDRPGVMSLEAGAELLGRYGVLAGEQVVVLSNRPDAAAIAEPLGDAGALIRIVDPTKSDVRAVGGRHLRGLEIDGSLHECDLVLSSAGLMPLLHLWSHAGGKLDWDRSSGAFMPGEAPSTMAAVGAANGIADLDEAIDDARKAALDQPRRDRECVSTTLHQPKIGEKRRQWIDFQHDVTVKDIELAARENMVSVEHLKRYTTLGMAADQGKSANVAGLAAMAALTGRDVSALGTTTFRPPYVPIAFEAYAGARRGLRFNPVKRLVLEAEHRALDAALGDYGGWLRPAWYGSDGMDMAVAREVAAARNAAGIMDASALGKIEVMGPDAGRFLNFVYYNTMATLKPGRIRYGFMLNESGVILDDGVLARIDETRFIVSCSSGHTDSIVRHLEQWRQDGNDPDRIFIHDVTANWATVTISGPKAKSMLQALDLGLEADRPIDHMTLTNGRYRNHPARIVAVSFTGDASVEISVPVDLAATLWRDVLTLGTPLGALPIGAEALSVLRAEKGYILVGKDTDGETMPHDLGFNAPRMKKTAAFIGDRSLKGVEADREDRKQLVGLEAIGGTPLPTGAHIVTGDGDARRSQGYVTSSYPKATLDRPVALALIEGGRAREGDIVKIWHMGTEHEARVTGACALTPKERASMRDDRNRWRQAEGWSRKLDDLPGLEATIVRPGRQTLISGPTSAALKAVNLADATGWPGPASGDRYAIRLRCDRLLVVDGDDRAHPGLDEGWHDELGIAVSDITGGLAVIELRGPSVPMLLATGAEIDPARPSPAASWHWHGMACVIYGYETDQLFRLHVSLSQLDAACDMVAWQSSSIMRLDR